MGLFPFIAKAFKGPDKMTTTPKLFTQIEPIDASTLPRPGTPDFKAHLDELVAAATEVIESTDKWKVKGKFHHMVEVRERTDWKGKYNWIMRRSIHKDTPFEIFKVACPRYPELTVAGSLSKPF